EADQRARHPRLLSYRIARLRQRITSGEDESPVERDEQPQARQCTWIVTSVLRPAFRSVFPRVELPWRAPVIPGGNSERPDAERTDGEARYPETHDLDIADRHRDRDRDKHQHAQGRHHQR